MYMLYKSPELLFSEEGAKQAVTYDKVSTITALKWNAATSQQCNLHGTTNLKKIGVSLEG